MAEHQQKTIVGVFALTGIILLGILILMYGGGRSLLENTYNISVHFPGGVFGVQEGQSVTLNGKRIGETQAIEFWNPKNVQEGVRVVVAIQSQYDLPAATRVEVAASIMGFGRPAIQIIVMDSDSTKRLSRDGKASIQGRMIPMLDQVLPPQMQQTLVDTASGIGSLVNALKPVVADLDKLLEPRETKNVDIEKVTANLSTVIERFDLVLKNFNRLIGDEENRENFKQAIANARSITEKGVSVTDHLDLLTQEGIQTMQNIDRLARKMFASVDGVSSVLTQLDRTLASINSKEGTAGLLINDNRLYEELLLSSRRLTKMLDEFREVLDIVKKGELKIRLNP